MAEHHLNWVNAYRQKVRRQISDISRRPAAALPWNKEQWNISFIYVNTFLFFSSYTI